MLLKVSDGNGGWVLFDEADQVHLVSVKHIISNQKDLESLMKGDTLNLVPKDSFTKNSNICVGEISFASKGKNRRVLFTNVAYICNDAGDTLERLSAQEYRANRR